MRVSNRYTVLFLYLGVQFVVCLLADQRASAQSTLPESTSSNVQYVLLTNDRVLSGTVLLRGDAVIVRRGSESELTLPNDRVLAIAADLPALFAARARAQRRPSLPSTNDHLADARWCIDQGLTAQAAELLQRVYAISPGHPVAMQLESRLRRTVAASAERPDPAVADTYRSDAANSNDILPVSHAGEGVSAQVLAAESPVAINATTAPASLHWFTAKVQPILISRCAKCHHDQADVPTNWNLVLPPGGSLRVTQRGSIANLEATLRLCNTARPESSELIVRAMQDHGNAGENHGAPNAHSNPPIREHETALLRTIVAWISELPEQPSLRGQPETRSASPPDLESNSSGPLSPISPVDAASSLHRPPPLTKSDTAPHRSAHTTAADANSDFEMAQSETPRSTIGDTRPVRLPTIERPNDVQHFNRETRLRRQLGLDPAE